MGGEPLSIALTIKGINWFKPKHRGHATTDRGRTRLVTSVGRNFHGQIISLAQK